jgi:hypothetical protein
MKKQLFSILALAIGFTACNSDGDKTAGTNDSTSTSTTVTTTTGDTANTATTSNTSNTDYAALADSFRVNSQAGNYLNPRTGKPLRIRYDATTHRAIDEATGEPVWRYVDRRNWWVYSDDNDNWIQSGSAKMDNNKLMYEGDNDAWVDYDTRYKTDDEQKMKTWKERVGDTKIKVDKDGDVKVKDKKTGEKTKYDADDNKVKNDQ